MKRQARVINRDNMSDATRAARAAVVDLLKLANDIDTDSMREERIAQCECRACFYRPRWGAACVTEQDCGCCGKEQVYGSTATDVLCLECAKKHSLCKHCGGDLEMRTRRKSWPAADVRVDGASSATGA